MAHSDQCDKQESRPNARKVVGRNEKLTSPSRSRGQSVGKRTFVASDLLNLPVLYLASIVPASQFKKFVTHKEGNVFSTSPSTVNFTDHILLINSYSFNLTNAS